jgi:hypothetical protein
MKKLLLGSMIGAALAATLPIGANAASTAGVYSNITNIQLWLLTTNLMTAEAPGSFSGLQFGGTAYDLNDDGYIDSADLTLTGLINFTANDLDMRLTLNLANGGYEPGSGITFTGGNVQIDIQTTEGWIPYPAIDASTTNLGFLANQPGHLADIFPGQTTAGIVRDALPGLWDGAIGGAGYNRAVASFVLFGQTAGFYMQGTIGAGFPNEEGPGSMLFGPAEVPVPGAVWLFGSALAGLAGAGRLRGRSAA